MHVTRSISIQKIILFIFSVSLFSFFLLDLEFRMHVEYRKVRWYYISLVFSSCCGNEPSSLVTKSRTQSRDNQNTLNHITFCSVISLAMLVLVEKEVCADWLIFLCVRLHSKKRSNILFQFSCYIQHTHCICFSMPCTLLMKNPMDAYYFFNSSSDKIFFIQ